MAGRRGFCLARTRRTCCWRRRETGCATSCCPRCASSTRGWTMRCAAWATRRPAPWPTWTWPRRAPGRPWRPWRGGRWGSPGTHSRSYRRLCGHDCCGGRCATWAGRPPPVRQGTASGWGARREVGGGGGEPAASQPIEETCLAVPGRTELPGWSVVAEIVTPPPAQARGRSRWEALLDADAAGGPLVVRSRRAGDRLRPLGLGGEKKLQDMLVDAKVPEEERDGVPLVCAPWGIVWGVGQRLGERAGLREGWRGEVWLRFQRRGAGR